MDAEAELPLSVVIPVFDEEDNLAELHARLAAALDETGRAWEVVYVDDGSRDRSLAVLRDLAEGDRRVRVVELARNYGQHAAILAGFEASRGAVVVTLDADLQNPPEEIPRLVATIDEGFDVVGTRRRDRQDPLFRRLASLLMNRWTRRVTGARGERGAAVMTDYGCMLRAYRRGVVERLLASCRLSSFIPLDAMLFARDAAEIEVAHAERARGVTKYGLGKLIALQLDLMTGLSFQPLRLFSYLGVVVALGAIALGVGAVALRLQRGAAFARFELYLLFSLLFLLVGGLFVGLGIVGEYVGRIHAEVRQRPRYVVRRVHGAAP